MSESELSPTPLLKYIHQVDLAADNRMARKARCVLLGALLHEREGYGWRQCLHRGRSGEHQTLQSRGKDVVIYKNSTNINICGDRAYSGADVGNLVTTKYLSNWRRKKEGREARGACKETDRQGSEEVLG